MNRERTSPASLRALQSAIEGAGDEQIVRIVDLVDTMDRQDAETIMAPLRARLRLLRLERPLQLNRLLGIPLESVLIDGPRWRPSAAAFPRSALQPLCDAIALRAPELIGRVEPMIAGVNTRDAARVRAAGEIFWPGAGAALKEASDPPASWARTALPPASFPRLAAAAGVCLTAALKLDALRDPTLNRAHVESSLTALLRQAASVSPLAWSMLLVVMFCALPEAQAPRDAVLSQGASDLRLAAEAAQQQIWAWIEAAGISAPRNLNDAAAALRERGAVLNALAGSRTQRPRAAAQQADLRAAYTQYLSDAARERLITPLADLSTSLGDEAMTALEEQARGLRRLLIEIRALGAAATEAEPLQHAVHAARNCQFLRPIDRARLAECLGFPLAAAKLLES